MPGVPPDALNTLKRAFKGMFRSKKKTPDPPASNRPQSQQQPSRQQQSDFSTSAVAAPPPPSSQQRLPPQSAIKIPTSSGQANAAPQIPPIQQGSPLSTTAESAEGTKQLPPTHPLSTGQQQRPQEAVPVNREAQPGPPATGASRKEEGLGAPVDGVGEGQEEQPKVSGLAEDDRLAVDGTRSGAVSAVDDGEGAEEDRVKNDSAVEQTGKLEEPSATAEDLPPPPPAKENIPPALTHPPTTNGATPTPRDQLARTSSSDDKIAVTMEEPPPIRAVRAAPGMSATSGPLEEFPEGYYSR